MSSNDLDTTAKAVLLSGRVLASAVPSLDSVVTATTRALDFGTVAVGGRVELDRRVFNRGYTTLQARLARSAEFVAGDTCFGFNARSGLVGDTATDAVKFEATGATPNTDYTAELLVAPAEEPLPGALALDTLRVMLTAHVIANGGVPSALRFAAPAPNPLRSNTMFACDLPRTTHVSLAIYDAGGRRITVLADGEHVAGRYQLRWEARGADGSALPAGLYFTRFTTLGLVRTARVALLP